MAMEPETADIRQILAAIWRGKWLIGVTTALAVAASFAVMARTTPVYEAAAKVLLDTRDRKIAGIPGVVGALDVDNAAVASEIALIRSEAVIGATVDRFALDKVPAFSAPRVALPDRALRKIGVLAPTLAAYLPVPDLPEMTPAAARDRARARLRDALNVSQEGRSFVIRIAVQTESPDLAAAVANGVAAIYVERQIGTKTEATTRASNLLNIRLASLKSEVAQADEAVERHKADQMAASAQSAAMTEQQMAEINRSLVAARASRAEAEARHGQIASLIEAKGRGAAADILSSPLILTLRQQRAEVARREAELATRYGPKHPKMLNVEAELRDLSAAISGEVTKLVAGLENDVGVALAREAALSEALSELEARAMGQSRDAVGLRQLEREADASRRVYETFLARWKETTEGAGLQDADARIISPAPPPAVPVGPARHIIGALAGITGMLAGLAIVFLAEMTNTALRTGAAAERLTGLPLIGRLPHLRRARDRRAVLSHLHRNPNGAYAEAVRGLRTGLMLSRSPARVVMITSSVPGEGKTTTCIALADMAARAGKSVVVVECDLRRPSLLAALGHGRARHRHPDLIAVLDGEADLADALVPCGASGALLLPVAAPLPSAADGFSADRFRNFIADLALRFDLVLLDTPPVLAVSDALMIGRAAEGCLFLIRWNHTPRQMVAEALDRLRAQNIPLIGAAMCRVNPRREASYAYGGRWAAVADYAPYHQALR